MSPECCSGTPALGANREPERHQPSLSQESDHCMCFPACEPRPGSPPQPAQRTRRRLRAPPRPYPSEDDDDLERSVSVSQHPSRTTGTKNWPGNHPPRGKIRFSARLSIAAPSPAPNQPGARRSRTPAALAVPRATGASSRPLLPCALLPRPAPLTGLPIAAPGRARLPASAGKPGGSHCGARSSASSGRRASPRPGTEPAWWSTSLQRRPQGARPHGVSS